MKRYIVKRTRNWTLVNVNKKGDTKEFSNRKSAISFVRNLIGTTDLIVQDEKENKFARVTGGETKEDTQDVRTSEVPYYVLKQSVAYDEFKRSYLPAIYAVVPAVFIAVTIVLFILWMIGGK